MNDGRMITFYLPIICCPYSLSHLYEDFYKTIDNADYQKDLDWFRRNCGVDMPINMPEYDVSIQIVKEIRKENIKKLKDYLRFYHFCTLCATCKNYKIQCVSSSTQEYPNINAIASSFNTLYSQLQNSTQPVYFNNFCEHFQL